MALGVAAIIAGGLVAAAVAHRPAEHPVWTSAYLVLIVGVAQIVFGAGQAWLSERLPATGWIAGEWIAFNLGNAGVIAGTVLGSFRMVLAGTVLFAAGIAAFPGLAAHLAGARATSAMWPTAMACSPAASGRITAPNGWAARWCRSRAG